MSVRSAMPPSRGNRPQEVGRPRLLPVEQTLFVLLTYPDLWHLVDEFVGRTSTPSTMRQALWRRGCEVRQRRAPLREGVVQVWARWPHHVPRTVAPWEEKA